MGKTRPLYPAEFREQMVELVQAGRLPAELSREFGVTAQTIANWVGAAGGQASRSQVTAGVLSGSEREELARLRRQLRQIQMECDILAKATAWFAKRSDAGSSNSSNS